MITALLLPLTACREHRTNVIELPSQQIPPVAQKLDQQVPGIQNPLSTSVQKPSVSYRGGEDPDFARAEGWPVKGPEPLAGAVLPDKRVVAYYGNPLSTRMGVLGEYPKEEMLRRLREEVARWRQADPAMGVQPALHLIAVIAQGEPGKTGKYRMIQTDEVVTQVYDWARQEGALLFIDIQTGHDDIRNLLPRFEWLLRNPDVHLGLDPEFNLAASGKVPGTKVGTYDAADLNYASGFLADIVRRYGLPPKILVVHRFTQNGITNYRSIKLRPEVQLVVNMDGWGAPHLKRNTFKEYVVREPVQYAGFKLFYHNDTRKGHPLLTPEELLRLQPVPLYIQYQ
jgi:hypothetical protein